MLVRLSCWLVLLAVACVAIADLEDSKEYTEEIEADINTFVDNVSFQPKCDCGSEATKCEFKEGQKVCTCKDGYIPVGPDKICTQMCNYTKPCQNGGTCSQNVCSCLNGTSGHLCKTIDECRSTCGWEDCLYNVTARDIYCQCSKGYAFDNYSKICRACDCGSYLNDENTCSYVEGRKRCTCREDYADRLGRCTSCTSCGFFSNGCHFDNLGGKHCNCTRGYSQLGNICERCDCGIRGINCTLSYGTWENKKSCKCEKGYAESYGTCKECDCGENGTCSFRYGEKICDCNYGFDEYQGICIECDCGDFSRCKLDRYGNKECTCDETYVLNSGVCTPCNCDPGTSCIFNNPFGKECICPHGYANFIGSCMECDCQMDDSNCTMDKGLKQCQCPKGFESSKDFMNPSCIDIDECLRPQDNDCPFSTKCVNKKGSYDCVCREGFEVIHKYFDYDIKTLGCKDIDECKSYTACMDIYSLCVNTPGSYRCECKAGYSVVKDGYSEKYSRCVEAPRPWRTGSIVIGCLFAFVILGLIIGICNKHCDA